MASGAAAGADKAAVAPRQLLVGEQKLRWDFEQGVDGWTAGALAAVASGGGMLRINSTGEDPYIFSPTMKVKGPLVVQLRVRVSGAGSGELFWTSDAGPKWTAKQSKSFRLKHDGQWHEYQVLAETSDAVTRLRIDPGSAPGTIDVDWIRVHAGQLHPLEIAGIESGPDSATVRVRNQYRDQLLVHVNDQSKTIAPSTEGSFEITGQPDVATQILPLDIRTQGFPVIHLPIGLYNAAAKEDWIALRDGGHGVDVARDGSAARFLLDGQVVAVAAPLVRAGDTVPTMNLAKQEATFVSFKGDAVTLDIRLQADGASIAIEGTVLVEGPVIRAMGALEQGVLAGVEYLGKGERSSSTLDVETDDHWRVRPDPMAITMPLMAVVTDRGMAAMTWRDVSLQPVFASPNFLDGTQDHRMALEGKSIRARVYVAPRQPIEQAIAWAVKEQGGFPDVPQAPRDDASQRDLLLKAFNESVAGKAGWGHAAEGRWERKPYADVASAIGRLSGRWPQTDALISGGAHIRNDSAYFMTGRAEQWLRDRTGEARSLIAEQQPDGSFRYDGPMRRGHHENTASGYNAWRAAILLDYAWLTGDVQSREAGLKCLDYIMRFRTPRGAQTHELPLHTPDLLASAYLVWAYARGYELTGKAEYLDAARRWALSGVPFIYLWGNAPTMRYATIPAFGATQWVEPNWIGLPVQWCGLVYGYALTLLSPHDRTLDWDKLARGILVAAEQMQYPDGELAGCLPDFYLLREQKRGGPSVNPGALVSLRLALQKRVDSLTAASNGTHRVASPFPVTIVDGVARIESIKGAGEYQVIVDGKRIVTLVASGGEEIPLASQPAKLTAPSSAREESKS
jgi:hypothetical protein